MSKFISKIVIFLFIPFIFSCKSDKTESIPTFTVSISHFEDILEINGLVDPVDVTTFSVPPRIDGEIVYLVDDDTFVKPGDTLCVLEDKGREQNYEEQKAQLESQNAELEKMKVDLAMRYALLEAQVQNNEAEMILTSLDSVNLQYLTKNQQRIKKLELERADIVKNQLKKKLKSLSIINQTEIRQMELRISQIRNRVERTAEELKSLIILSTESGIASRATNPMNRQKMKIGDNVWEGLPLVVVPKMEQMKVVIQASEGEYKLLNIGDSVAYTFDAMPGNKAYGKILMKSPVGQPLKDDSKVKFFEVEASIEKIDVIPKPAYSANCKIFLKIIPDTIVVPQVAIFEQDSMDVVYVKKGKHFEKRQIEIGTSSLKSAIVSAGLQPNEVISLSKPAGQLIQGEKLLPKPKKETKKEDEKPELNKDSIIAPETEFEMVLDEI